jgi:hypothetical protein
MASLITRITELCKRAFGQEASTPAPAPEPAAAEPEPAGKTVS